ncbi:hypothetical protein HQ560_22360, partial [bacterium]|nr:hypothetical protein [bacterium]
MAADDVDVAASASFVNGKPTPAPRDALLAVLGIKPSQGRGWAAADDREHKKDTFAYRIAFTKPIAVGSFWVDSGVVHLLKSDAPFPGDPAKADHWVAPAVQARQSRPHLVTAPVGTATRAILVTVPPGWRRQPLRMLRLAKRRWANCTPEAAGQADSQYTLFHQLGPPHVYAAANVVRGQSRWQNTGKDQNERIRRAPVSDVAPSWFVLSWDEEKTLHGLLLRDNFERFQLHTFAGPAAVSPVAAVEREWRRIDDTRQSRTDKMRWVWFDSPVKTRGLRILILKTREKQIATIEALHAIADLGAAPVPEAIAQEKPAPPCRIPYALGQDGQVTLAIDGPDGRRVRNLVARAPRKKGENAEFWDLRDGEGRVVAPGSYTWKALTWEPFQLRYEMTPYPNIGDNAPENSPWGNGHSGPGGWLADHTPNFGVCTAGDWVYFGAPCAESGQSFIACDLEGRKQWGIHSFAAWTGPKRMAANRTTVFIENQAWQGSDGGMDRVWAIDAATHKVKAFFQRGHSERRRRGIAGMAADEKRVYLAIRGTVAWLSNAVGVGDIDLDRCVPRYKAVTRSSLQGSADRRSDFLRLFRITGTPAGDNGLIWLESTKGPSRRQHIVLAFTKPVSLGSLVFPRPANGEDVSMKLSVLKPASAWPPDVGDEAQWARFEDLGNLAWNVVPVPEGKPTRALRITFTKGADDELTDVLDDAKLAPWMGRLEGMRLLKRRYKNLAGTARITANSGAVAKDGSWDAEREEPLTPENPGIYTMTWQKPQRVRGLAIQEIDGKDTEIDVQTADGAWQRIATYTQKRRYYYQPDPNRSYRARYVDGVVDFGKDITTRAIRLRVVSQYVVRKDGRAGLYGVREDRGGLDIEPQRCRIYGVAPVEYLGGGPAEDPLLAQRIEALDAADGKVLQEIPIEAPGDLKLDPEGRLVGISANRVVAVDLEKGNHKSLVTDLVEPTAIAFDSKGDLYVYDAAPDRKVIRVYDRAGKFLRTFGSPGGYKVGPWDPTRFQGIHSIAVDKKDRLWAVSADYWPKRISQWDARKGTFLKEFLGNTAYGGGGVLDPWDKRRLIYGNLEFELDWETGATRLKNLLWDNGWESGDVPVRIDGRMYVVTRQQSAHVGRPVGIVYLYEKNRLRRVAAVGLANYFSGLHTPAILRKLGTHALEEYQFIWSDRSGDGKPQPDEVTFTPKRIRGVTPFNRDLGCQAGSVRF